MGNDFSGFHNVAQNIITTYNNLNFYGFPSKILNSDLGGTITYIDANGLNPTTSGPYLGGYTLHTFTASETYIVRNNHLVDYLVVAGGGGGGSNSANSGSAGGGGGGVLAGSNYQLISGSIITVTVGPSVGASTNGNNSLFDTFTAIGGGRGAGNGVAGGNGGCGGGAWYNQTVGSGTAGPPRQGYNGGASTISANYGGGGGGGAGAIGVAGTTTYAGTGGTGAVSSITGVATYYAGGGGGCGYSLAGAPGGTGGGGAGNLSVVAPATSGTNGFGGGGGGGNFRGGNGGSGIVIIRYRSYN